MDVDGIKIEWEKVKEKYPHLGDLVLTEEGLVSNGKIEIIDPSGILWRTLKVQIEIPEKYPLTPPVIYEIGGELPHEPEWHINGDGSCCVGPNAKIFRLLNSLITIEGWLNIIVMPYFFDQVHKLEKGVYKGKEYAHGSYGLIEDYKDWWKLEHDKEVIEKLKLITNWNKYPRNKSCYCGSGIKFKKCHLLKQTFENIPIQVYREDLRLIQKEHFILNQRIKK